jgi:hypothetical protein
MAKQKPSGWLDKYSDNVAATDATRISKQLTPLNKNKITQAQLDEREAQERRNRIKLSNSRQANDFDKPAEDLATYSSATADKLRFSEYPNFFDDYINPGVQFGHLASGLGQVPLNIKKGNYGEAALNTLSPVMAGAAETLLSPIINKVMKRGNKSAILAESNQLAPPPSEIIIPNDGYIMGMSFPSNITRSPAGGLFGMTTEQTNAARANISRNINTFDWNSLKPSFSDRIHSGIQSMLGMNSPRTFITSSRPRQSLLQSLGESIYTGIGGGRRSHNQYVPFSQLVAEQNAGRGMTNISGFGNEQLLASDALINKDVVAKMAPEEFASTVYKPSGEVAPYQNMYDPLPGVYGMSPSQYANRFNENLDLLNDIISKQNKTGVDYRVTGLDENGMLTFHTPKQIKRWQDDPFNVKMVEDLEKIKNDPVELQNRLHANAQTLEDFDRGINVWKEDRIIAPEGNRTWATRIIPGEFRGEIQDIPNAEYYKSIPGLNMSSSSQGVFSDKTRRGSGAYEAINEYLKRLDLGRVKPGFNSQSDSSRPLWENAIKKGKAFGYYSNPHTVYGAMKTVAPVIGAGAVASEFIDQKKNGGWLEKYNDGGPIQPNYNDSNASAGPGFEGDGYSNVGRNYSPAWGGQFAMGGSIGGATQGIPGATGFMYARTGSIPSNGKYAKKTKASAQNGAEMKFYQEGLDFKPKSISKNGSQIIKDDRGQWAYPGEITEIGSNQITMQGVPYPVMGISDTGDTQMMYPEKDYQYDGNSVTEYPMMAQGGQLTKLDQLTNFTNYNTKQPGGWLDKYQ